MARSTLSAGLLAGFLALTVAAPALARGPEPGDPAPELEVKDWQNGSLKVLEQQGSVVVLLFFQTNAPDMDKYIKRYVDMIASYGPKGLKVAGVSREAKETIANWLDEQKISFPVAVDKGSWKGNYGIDGYPFAYVIDIYGEVAWKGDGNRPEWVIPQLEVCLKEVKRIDSVKREETSKAFEKIWRALDKSEFANAVKFLDGILKGQDETDRKHAELILKDLNAIADARLKRVAQLEKRLDYGSGEPILRGVEKGFAGLPQSKAAKEILERWLKDPKILAEIRAQRAFDQGRVLEDAREYKKAADCYRQAMAFPGTRGGQKASTRHAELVKKGKIPP